MLPEWFLIKYTQNNNVLENNSGIRAHICNRNKNGFWKNKKLMFFKALKTKI